ncbi:MAG: zinc ABC transporter substrate-binding protein, partial [Burkholderiales bacterium]|nr:zinc ABC transporter substrate-binding protein [Burkholderiales bacterium]
MNVGFPKACNQGLSATQAAVSPTQFLLLNNDTIVTPGLLRRMIECMRRAPDGGLVGPRTSFAKGHQQLKTGYQTMQALDAWAQAQIATIPADKRKVITSHDAFGYFAAHYGIRFLAPQGISTDAEPSAKQVAQLIKQIQREKIHAVFLENMSNPKLLEQISKDAGATVGASLYADALSVPGQPGATYLEMARYNVSALLAGMQKN